MKSRRNHWAVGSTPSTGSAARRDRPWGRARYSCKRQRDEVIRTHAQAIGIAQSAPHDPQRRRLRDRGLTMVAEIEEALGKIEAFLDPAS